MKRRPVSWPSAKAFRSCLRAVSSASGGGYRLTVRAVEPTKEEPVSTTSEEARSKSDVLQAVGRVADSMRRALGDAMPSDRLAAETFTAASLEAVKNYTIAQTLSSDRKNEEAITYYQRAIQEDKNFGRAYAGWAAARPISAHRRGASLCMTRRSSSSIR